MEFDGTMRVLIQQQQAQQQYMQQHQQNLQQVMQKLSELQTSGLTPASKPTSGLKPAGNQLGEQYFRRIERLC
jgi:hypothetical protein